MECFDPAIARIASNVNEQTVNQAVAWGSTAELAEGLASLAPRVCQLYAQAQQGIAASCRLPVDRPVDEALDPT